MLSILILGGTGFIGTTQVRYALARGHRVSVFNRGTDAEKLPEGIELLTGDRDTNDYASIKGRTWDVCIDVPARVPHWVRDAGVVLKGQVGQYIYVSTVSVYANNAEPGQDESAARSRYTGADPMAETALSASQNMSMYGALKALCEDEVNKAFTGIATIVRPGLIVGPGDKTDRFTYWPVRIARGGDVLTPPLTEPVQFIDARDLGEWTIRLAEERTFGTFNANGPAQPLTFGRLLACAVDVTKSNARLREVTTAFLRAHGIEPWSDLPVWIPSDGESGGSHRRSISAAIAAGLTFRPLATTIADTLAWHMTRPTEQRETMRAGLTADRERSLLDMLQRGDEADLGDAK
ncbi:MAG: NAD-dependent epimerase/dehydratase family protein [Burkholderiales bacterium]|nr:NAD-dependent epimerase/dehydratase family protein [Burkholderiales bacterium]